MFINVDKEEKSNQLKFGGGLVNNIIDNLPIELHLPGYQFCGPGTKLNERLARGDNGINLLDAACKDHDIAYSQLNDISERHRADKILAEKAWKRVKSKDSDFKEKAHAWFVANAMKAKVKLGLGMSTAKKSKTKFTKKKCKKVEKRKNKNIFSKAVKNTLQILKKEKPQNINDAVKIAKNVIKSNFKSKKRSNIVIPRVIPMPKIGGFLPIIPALTALSALGGLASGGTAIVKAINDIKNGKQQLTEANRHNRVMESIAMGKGLYLKPYRKGFGLYYNPASKNF